MFNDRFFHSSLNSDFFPCEFLLSDFHFSSLLFLKVDAEKLKLNGSIVGIRQYGCFETETYEKSRLLRIALAIKARV